MRLFGKPAIWTARAVVALAILAFACVDSQEDAPPPRAAAPNPAPTATTAPEPTPTAAPKPTATSAPAPTATSAPAPTATAAPAPTAPAQAAAPTSDPAEAFQSAVDAMGALSSYHADMEHVAVVDMMGTPAEFRTEIQSEIQPPDKMRGDMSIAMGGEPLPTNGFALIGGDAYVSLVDPDNPQTPVWLPSDPADIEGTVSFLTWFEPDSQYEFAPEALAEEDLDGENTYRLSGSFTVLNLPADVEQPDNMRGDVWIGADDRLIRKTTAAGSTETIETALEITVTYTRFNDPTIKVEAP